MKIIWFTWKDRQNPLAGGAEAVNEEIAKRLAARGDEVILVVRGFKGCKSEEKINGYKVVRLGNRWSVYWRAYRYYKKFLRGWADLAIDEINTIPFFCKFYAREKNILFVHQLAREIWFYEIFFPLNLIGYLLEPIHLWLLRDREVVTVSASSKKDLTRYGFKEEKIHIISEGIEIQPVENLDAVVKYDQPTILSFGSIRQMKRTSEIIKAFEAAKKEISDLRLIVAGDASSIYGRKVLQMIKRSPYAGSMEYLGLVSKEKKIELMQKSHLLCSTSVKEGWGLVVTEANSQGTPTVVYNVDGLRDSVRDGETGIVCAENTPEMMAKNIIGLLKDAQNYQRLRQNSWKWSKEINFEKSFNDFSSVIGKIWSR